LESKLEIGLAEFYENMLKKILDPQINKKWRGK
jgi:hypothetical protein